MRQLILGIVVGVVVGAGGTYLVLRPPAAAPMAVAAIDAGAPPDGAARSRRRGKRGRPHRPAAVAAAGEEQDPPEAPERPVPQLDARDRQVAWRGPAIATPTRRLDLAKGGEARTLSQDEIDRGIRTNAAAVTACIRDARGEAPLAGTVTLEFLVEGNGHATRSRVQAAQYLLDHGLLACGQRAVHGMRFAATGAPTVVTVPFEVR